jgi:mannose-1-phosphate guanylyltransferase
MRTFNVYLAGAQENYFTSFEKSILHAHNFEIAENSYFELTINRNKKLCENHILVTDLGNFKHSREILESCGIKNNIEIIEPEMNCFTRAIAYACFTIDPEDVVLVYSPNDYLLTEKKLNYEKIMTDAISLAEKGEMVIIGTSDPLTHSRYQYSSVQNDQDFNALFFKGYYESSKNTSLRNTGIYCFRADKFLAALKKLDPSMYQAAKKATRKQEGGFLNEILCKEIPNRHLEFSFFNQLTAKVLLEASFTCSEYIQFEEERHPIFKKEKAVQI